MPAPLRAAAPPAAVRRPGRFASACWYTAALLILAGAGTANLIMLITAH